MDEQQLRLDYWEDNRTRPEFPLWVIFKFIGHALDTAEGVPYLRHAQRELPAVLKDLEAHPAIDRLAEELRLSPQELRASLWYCVWLLEHQAPPDAWRDWNRRVDEAWSQHVLGITNQRSNDE